MSSDGEGPDPASAQARLQRLSESELFSLPQWRRRILFWSGAVLVGLAAVGFAEAADWAYRVFHGVITHNRYWAFLITPLTFALLAWLTQGALKAT
ncbi:MAG: chloride channel protein, partial [Dyella sp.]|nr:chloride channel protein [Dyella sp.]